MIDELKEAVGMGWDVAFMVFSLVFFPLIMSLLLGVTIIELLIVFGVPATVATILGGFVAILVFFFCFGMALKLVD